MSNDFRRLSGLPPLTESATVEGTEVADTIAKQMGGLGKLRMMIGAKNITAGDNSLSFQFPNPQRSKGNGCRITLRPDDTYDMEFFSGSAAKVVKKIEGVYADQLMDLFEKQTGLYLTLAPRKPTAESKDTDMNDNNFRRLAGLPPLTESNSTDSRDKKGPVEESLRGEPGPSDSDPNDEPKHICHKHQWDTGEPCPKCKKALKAKKKVEGKDGDCGCGCNGAGDCAPEMKKGKKMLTDKKRAKLREMAGFANEDVGPEGVAKIDCAKCGKSSEIGVRYVSAVGWVGSDNCACGAQIGKVESKNVKPKAASGGHGSVTQGSNETMKKAVAKSPHGDNKDAREAKAPAGKPATGGKGSVTTPKNSTMSKSVKKTQHGDNGDDHMSKAPAAKAAKGGHGKVTKMGESYSPVLSQYRRLLGENVGVNGEDMDHWITVDSTLPEDANKAACKGCDTMCAKDKLDESGMCLECAK